MFGAAERSALRTASATGNARFPESGAGIQSYWAWHLWIPTFALDRLSRFSFPFRDGSCAGKGRNHGHFRLGPNLLGACVDFTACIGFEIKQAHTLDPARTRSEGIGHCTVVTFGIL